MGFFKNAARAVGRQAKKRAKRAVRTAGNKLFGQTYTNVAKKRRTAARRAR